MMLLIIPHGTEGILLKYTHFGAHLLGCSIVRRSGGGEGVESCAAATAACVLHHQQALETAKQKSKDPEDWIHEKNQKKSGFRPSHLSQIHEYLRASSDILFGEFVLDLSSGDESV